jgi:hypothetical protein
MHTFIEGILGSQTGQMARPRSAAQERVVPIAYRFVAFSDGQPSGVEGTFLSRAAYKRAKGQYARGCIEQSVQISHEEAAWMREHRSSYEDYLAHLPETPPDSLYLTTTDAILGVREFIAKARAEEYTQGCRLTVFVHAWDSWARSGKGDRAVSIRIDGQYSDVVCAAFTRSDVALRFAHEVRQYLEHS